LKSRYIAREKERVNRRQKTNLVVYAALRLAGKTAQLKRDADNAKRLKLRFQKL
jgi:hypothetical protein